VKLDCILKNGKGIRVIDAHSVPHQKAPKAVKACDAANVLDGVAMLQNLTLKLVSTAFSVSVSSIVTAQRLMPDQRTAVRRGERPLTLPATATIALPAPKSPIGDVELVDIARQVGSERMLNAAAAAEARPITNKAMASSAVRSPAAPSAAPLLAGPDRSGVQGAVQQPGDRG
jgi:hypothetical protein